MAAYRIYTQRMEGYNDACGHDMHTAALLGVAKVLSEVKDDIKGTIVFIHQFAEEVTPGGAKPMIETGCLDVVDSSVAGLIPLKQAVVTVGSFASGIVFDDKRRFLCLQEAPFIVNALC